MPKTRDRAYVILMGVGDENPVQRVGTICDELWIGRHDFNAGSMRCIGKANTAIDHNPTRIIFRAIPVKVHIHADFASTAERQIIKSVHQYSRRALPQPSLSLKTKPQRVGLAFNCRCQHRATRSPLEAITSCPRSALTKRKHASLYQSNTARVHSRMLRFVFARTIGFMQLAENSSFPCSRRKMNVGRSNPYIAVGRRENERAIFAEALKNAGVGRIG